MGNQGCQVRAEPPLPTRLAFKVGMRPDTFLAHTAPSIPPDVLDNGNGDGRQVDDLPADGGRPTGKSAAAIWAVGGLMVNDNRWIIPAAAEVQRAFLALTGGRLGFWLLPLGRWLN